MTVGPHSRYITLYDREIHYMEWGQDTAPPVVLAHGLARTGRDFDDLAVQLSKQYRLIVPDMLGRGLSQWSPEPETEYCLAFYAKLMTALCDALKFQHLRWVGTSMGGAIGLYLAAGTLRDRISHLVLNDIGPEIGHAAVTRIRSYAGTPPSFTCVTELEAYFRTIYKPFGSLTDQQWRRLTETSFRRLPDGRITPHYDPNIVLQFEAHPEDYIQWMAYDSLKVRALCLRGIDSDLLLPETAMAMTRRGPHAQVITIPGCGHAPALNVPEQFQPIEDFLKS
ncbi:MAG: alpha/beta hydrolase [Alphaproteobacteria bacterium]